MPATVEPPFDAPYKFQWTRSRDLHCTWGVGANRTTYRVPAQSARHQTVDAMLDLLEIRAVRDRPCTFSLGRRTIWRSGIRRHYPYFLWLSRDCEDVSWMVEGYGPGVDAPQSTGPGLVFTLVRAAYGDWTMHRLVHARTIEYRALLALTAGRYRNPDDTPWLTGDWTSGMLVP